MSNELTVKQNVVVSLAYTLTVDGEIADQSPVESPLEYIQGRNNLISGLESQIEGLKTGDKKSVVVAPADGYGTYDEEAVISLDRAMFGDSYPLAVGNGVHLQDDANNRFEARIVSFNDKEVVVDLNHPMAGKELHFDVEIVSLREPTKTELDAGFIPPAGYSSCGGSSCSSCCSGCGG